MISRVRSLLFAIMVAMGALATADAASAQVVFQAGPSGTTLGAGVHNQYLTRFTVPIPVTITGIAQRSLTNTQSQVRFVIVNTDTVDVLYSSSKIFPSDAGVATYKKSDYFSYTLQPGINYSIGGISDQVSTVYIAAPPAVQNDIQAWGNNEFTGSAALVRTTLGGGVIDLQLFRGPGPVPTLSEWAMILLGLTLAGVAAAVIQRRLAA